VDLLGLLKLAWDAIQGWVGIHEKHTDRAIVFSAQRSPPVEDYIRVAAEHYEEVGNSLDWLSSTLVDYYNGARGEPEEEIQEANEVRAKGQAVLDALEAMDEALAAAYPKAHAAALLVDPALQKSVYDAQRRSDAMGPFARSVLYRASWTVTSVRQTRTHPFGPRFADDDLEELINRFRSARSAIQVVAAEIRRLHGV
jgi:hypothetical protein